MDFPSKELLKYLGRATKSVNKLTKQSKSLNNEAKYNDIKHEFENESQQEQKAKVHFFGLRFMDLGSRYSNLDIFMETGTSFWEPIEVDDNRRLILEHAKYLKNNTKWNVDHIFLNQSPGPMIKATQRIKSLNCEISFTSGLNVLNTRLIAHLFKMQPEAIKFYHFVRIWIHICGLSFERYLVCILVIYYLQQINLMPGFKTMQTKSLKPVQMIGKWEVHFNEFFPVEFYGVKWMKNYEDHVVGFFQFYANFDFDNDVVFPYLGNSVSKQNYPDNKELNQFREVIGDFKWQNPMAVAGMLDLNFNCAWDIKEKRLKHFVDSCKESAILLANNNKY